MYLETFFPLATSPSFLPLPYFPRLPIYSFCTILQKLSEVYIILLVSSLSFFLNVPRTSNPPFDGKLIGGSAVQLTAKVDPVCGCTGWLRTKDLNWGKASVRKTEENKDAYTADTNPQCEMIGILIWILW
jgi:hypothetical protein